MLFKIKELSCVCNKGILKLYNYDEETVFINIKNINIIRDTRAIVDRLIPNPEFNCGLPLNNFADVEEFVEEQNLEKVYQVHMVGCSLEEAIVIDESAMISLREAV